MPHSSPQRAKTIAMEFLADLIREILNEDDDGIVFADLSYHLNLFMYLPKTPFIWHITSGPRRGFDAFIIIYKWSRDKLFTITDYH